MPLLQMLLPTGSSPKKQFSYNLAGLELTESHLLACLPGAGIKGVCYQAWLFVLLFFPVKKLVHRNNNKNFLASLLLVTF
jgi:hypothetical protein